MSEAEGSSNGSIFFEEPIRGERLKLRAKSSQFKKSSLSSGRRGITPNSKSERSHVRPLTSEAGKKVREKARNVCDQLLDKKGNLNQMKIEKLEKNWNSRFVIEHIPEYSVTQDKHARTFTRSNIFLKRMLDLEKKTVGSPFSPKFSRPGVRDATDLKRHSKLTTLQKRRASSPPNGSPYMPSMKNHTKIASSEVVIEKLKYKIEKLWEELHFPIQEREYWRDHMFNNYPDDQNNLISILSDEVTKLNNHKKDTINVLKGIEHREMYLKSFHSILDQLGDVQKLCEEIKNEGMVLNCGAPDTISNGFPKIPMSQRNSSKLVMIRREFQKLLTAYRISTLEVTEAIMKWRSKLLKPKPFSWKSMNYVLKMQTDIQFFTTLPRNVTNIILNEDLISEYKNPFLKTATSTPSNYTSIKNKVKNYPQSHARSLKLPPLLSSVVGVRRGNPQVKKNTPGRDPFKERISIAEKVILAETSLAEQYKQFEDRSTEEFIPTLKPNNNSFSFNILRKHLESVNHLYDSSFATQRTEEQAILNLQSIFRSQKIVRLFGLACEKRKYDKFTRKYIKFIQSIHRNKAVLLDYYETRKQMSEEANNNNEISENVKRGSDNIYHCNFESIEDSEQRRCVNSIQSSLLAVRAQKICRMKRAKFDNDISNEDEAYSKDSLDNLYVTLSDYFQVCRARTITAKKKEELLEEQKRDSSTDCIKDALKILESKMMVQRCKSKYERCIQDEYENEAATTITKFMKEKKRDKSS